jgi:hypothetical protein
MRSGAAMVATCRPRDAEDDDEEEEEEEEDEEEDGSQQCTFLSHDPETTTRTSGKYSTDFTACV